MLYLWPRNAVNQTKEHKMQKNRARLLAGGALVAAALLVGGAALQRPAAATPTMTVYKAPT